VQEKSELTLRENRLAFQRVHPKYTSSDSVNSINVGAITECCGRR
jgi:hypothetical protein